jgi:AcrR family transcriptional regulator
VQDVTVPAERWTQERRRQHTRDLLLDAAEEVFAKRGFEGASLEEIAETAGYTRGAIYKHFGGKEELFLEANTRFNERYVQAFVELVEPSESLEELDLAAIAQRWRDMNRAESERFTLGAEFNLYVLRHPECRAQVVAQRRRNAERVAAMIEEQAAHFGLKLKMPAMTVARVALAASDGIELASRFDDDDVLYPAFLELLLAMWEIPES